MIMKFKKTGFKVYTESSSINSSSPDSSKATCLKNRKKIELLTALYFFIK